MVKFAAHLLAFATLLATPLAAEETPHTNALVDIPKEEWVSMVAGRTVVYKIGLDLWAFETYSRDSNFVSIQLANGECMDGTWNHIDGTFCFAWDNREYSCFRHARAGEEILIIPTVDGQPAGTTQTVSDITDAPMPCGPDLVS